MDYGIFQLRPTLIALKKIHPPKGRVCPSIDLVCEVEKSALENTSVSFRRSTFRVSFLGFMQKRLRKRGRKKKIVCQTR